MPRSTITHGVGLGWEYRRSGYSFVTNGTWYGRQAWDAWGPAGAVTETPRTYTRYSASVTKEIYLSLLTKARLNAAYFGGRDLDRFSTYQFGLFDDTKIHGVPAAGVRYDELAMVRGSYSFNAFEQYRFDAFIDRGWGRLRGAGGTDWEGITGIGAAFNLRAPWSTILRAEIGKSFLAPALSRERIRRRADPVPEAAQGQGEIGGQVRPAHGREPDRIGASPGNLPPGDGRLREESACLGHWFGPALALVALAAMASHGDAQSARPGTANGAAVEAVHDRTVHERDGGPRRGLLGRRVALPVLLEQDRHLERLLDPGRRRRVDAGHDVDGRFDLRGLVLPDGRSRAVHARPGRQRAESPLREDAGRPGEGPHARREAEGPVLRLVGRSHGLLRQHERTGPALLRSLPLRREDAGADGRLQERPRLPAGRHLARRQVGRAGEGEHDQRHRPLPVERRQR